MRYVNIISILVIMMLFISCKQYDAGRDKALKVGGAGIEQVDGDVEVVLGDFTKLVDEVLGKPADVNTKKSDISGFFKKLGEGLDQAIAVTDIEAAKKSLEDLKGSLNSLSKATDGGDGKVGDVQRQDIGGGQGANPVATKEVLKGLKTIATVAGIIPNAGDVAVGSDNVIGAKALAEAGDAGVADTEKTLAILGSVTEEQILAAIIVTGENDVPAVAMGGAANLQGASSADATTTAVQFAVVGVSRDSVHGNPNVEIEAKVKDAKAASVAGGIALRSLIQGGKLSSAEAAEEAVQKVGVEAANKLLVAIKDAIKTSITKILADAKTAV
ncbi:variable large family protein [Candidatus Borreliella tachyglossi]|uniref:variable large family protein n=1 Tax=Candidatus Borreliella tachyglossi TaxID=1964448 RepID=UPI0040422FEF